MHFTTVLCIVLSAVTLAVSTEDVDYALLEELGVTITHAEAVAANVTFENFISDAAVFRELGCSSSGFCGGSTILDVAWNLKARCFVKAAIYSGFAGVLKRQGQLTAFVPSDRAFAKLPLPLHLFFFTHRQALRDVLEFHVANGVFPSSKLYDEEVVNTVAHNLTIRYNIYHHSGKPDIKSIQGSPISRFDQQASNGVVHLVDDVILKFTEGSLYERFRRSTGFSSFYNALVIAGLDQYLKALPYGTVFAASNQAIADLPAGYWSNLLNNKTALKEVLNFHISPNGVYFSRGLRNGDIIATLNKRNSLTVQFNDRGVLSVNNATVQFRDVGASNGIIDGINRLLIPSKTV